jgi:hypothetical protein
MMGSWLSMGTLRFCCRRMGRGLGSCGGSGRGVVEGEGGREGEERRVGREGEKVRWET